MQHHLDRAPADPVGGMTVKPASAAATRDGDGKKSYNSFSAHGAFTFDTDSGRSTT